MRRVQGNETDESGADGSNGSLPRSGEAIQDDIDRLLRTLHSNKKRKSIFIGGRRPIFIGGRPEATMEFLEREIFYRYAVPACLISDNGPQLRSNKFAEFLSRYNVKHWKTPNYHPQANATEAANKTIMNAVRAYLRDEEKQRNWDAYLPEISCALNTAQHSTTKYPPYTVLYG